MIDFPISFNAAEIYSMQNAKRYCEMLQKSMNLRKAYKKKVDTQGCT